jgi:acetylornithine deacetylase/succinyl-diaminopimelate desuccinylase-like protein
LRPRSTRRRDLSANVQRWREAHEAEVVREPADLMAIPNVMADRPNIRLSADALVAALARRGVEARLLEEPDASPLVFGKLRAPGAKRTVVLHVHHDGQPADPASTEGPRATTRGPSWRCSPRSTRCARPA